MGRTKKESKDAGVIYLNANGSYIEEKDSVSYTHLTLPTNSRV